MVGVVFAMVLVIPLALGFSSQVMMVCAMAFVGLMGGVCARLENNDVIPAFLWNGMFAAVTLVLVRTCMGIFF